VLDVIRAADLGFLAVYQSPDEARKKSFGGSRYHETKDRLTLEWGEVFDIQPGEV
jgi:hypothetical protein